MLNSTIFLENDDGFWVVSYVFENFAPVIGY